MAFNKSTVPSELGTKSDYIPHSQVSKVKHYQHNILIACKDGSLYVTREFTVDAKGMYGEFEREPYNNAVGSGRVQCVEPNQSANPHANTE